MILVILISALLAGGLISWILGRWSKQLPKYISLAALLFALYILIIMWHFIATPTPLPWKIEYIIKWIPAFGISFHLAIDGLSYIMIFLTFILGIIAVLFSWNSIHEKTGFYFFNLLWMLAGITGIFLAIDLFLFYFFWEVMLIPLYFIMLLWGGENRNKSAFKFLVYTQGSSLLMLISILILSFLYTQKANVITFDYNELIMDPVRPGASLLLMGGFMIAFFVKFPIIPFHGWIPDAFSSSPVGANITGLLIKTGAYGMFRFAIPLFPKAAMILSPYMMTLGVITIIYGAILAFSQTNIYRLIAYSTISHMGFVLLGLFAFTEMAYQGVIIQMIASALSSCGLLLIAAIIRQRTGSDDLQSMGGLWKKVPILSGFTLVFALASLGLPATANFVAEFMILAGTFKINILMTCLACIGLVISAVYALRLVQKFAYGSVSDNKEIADASPLARIILGALIILTIGIGLFPQSLINRAKPAIEKAFTVNYPLHPDKK